MDTQLFVSLTVPQAGELVKKWVREASHPIVEEKSPKFYSRKEAAQLLGITLPTLHRYTGLGILPARRIGNRVLYNADELERAISKIPMKHSLK